MISREDQKLLDSYLTGAIDISGQFSEVSEVISEGCNVRGAKASIKQKVNKVLQFAMAVFGSEELTTIAKPFIVLPAAAQPVIP